MPPDSYSAASHFGGVTDWYQEPRKDLIDVYEGELTIRVGEEAITFNLDQTSRYSANYNDMMANRIDIIDMACEEYSQEVLGERKPKKGQNRIKIRQKREAWRSREKSEAVTISRGS
nr:reverse transcriptase domain-containing protein [Tanacetum cinerariifolium]